MTPEGRIVKEILDYLSLVNVFAWRNNTGAMPSGDGKRFLRFGRPGSADILGIMADGRFLAIECKTKTGRLTPGQAEFLEAIRERGGVAFVARSVEDVWEEFNREEA